MLGVSVPSGVELSLADGDRATGLSARGLRFFSNRTRDWKMPFMVAEASLGIATQLVNRKRLELCPPDVLLEIHMPNVGLLANDKSADAIEAGRRAAMNRMPALIELRARRLPPRWWRSLESVLLRLRRAWTVLLEPGCPLYTESGDLS